MNLEDVKLKYAAIKKMNKLDIKGFSQYREKMVQDHELTQRAVNYQRGILTITDTVDILARESLNPDRRDQIITAGYFTLYKMATGIILASARSIDYRDFLEAGGMDHLILEERVRQIEKWGVDKKQDVEGYVLIFRAKSSQLLAQWMQGDDNGIRKYAVQIATLAVVAFQNYKYDQKTKERLCSDPRTAVFG